MCDGQWVRRCFSPIAVRSITMRCVSEHTCCVWVWVCGRGEEEGGDSATSRHSLLSFASRVRALILLLSKVEKRGVIAQTDAHAHCLIHVMHCETALSMLVVFGLSVALHLFAHVSVLRPPLVSLAHLIEVAAPKKSKSGGATRCRGVQSGGGGSRRTKLNARYQTK